MSGAPSRVLRDGVSETKDLLLLFTWRARLNLTYNPTHRK